MAFGIVTTFRRHKPVLVARHHNLRVFQIGIFRLWLHSCCCLILRQHGEEHQLSAQLRIVARFQEERRRLEGILVFLAHISRQLHHLPVLEIGTIRKEDIDIRNILSLGIREIHEGKIVDIHRSDESAHVLHLFLLSISQCQDSLLGSRLHEIERFKERGSGTVPVADAFLATAIIGITLQKGSQTLLHSLEGCISLLGIGFANQNSFQPVARNPGIPVVGIVLPALRLVQYRLQESAIYLASHTVAESLFLPIDFIFQHIEGPGKHTCRLCIEEINRLDILFRMVFRIMRRDSPPGFLLYKIM